MNTLWLTWENTPALPYPLSFNLPRASWTLEANTISLLPEASEISLHVDLVFELAREVGPGCDSPKADCIRGYRFCVGVADNSFLKHAPVPSIRDSNVCRYYARWPRGYNVLGPLWSADWESLSARFPSTPLRMLEFFRGFNRLIPGDLVSLGSLEDPKLLREFPVSLQVGILDQRWDVTVNEAN